MTPSSRAKSAFQNRRAVLVGRLVGVRIFRTTKGDPGLTRYGAAAERGVTPAAAKSQAKSGSCNNCLILD